jgi:hypothetical protein
MIHRLVHELAEDADLRVDETVACRVLRVSRSGYYGWLGRAPSVRQVADEQLSTTITEIHAAPRGTYGAPRVHAELRLGLGVPCRRSRVARLMRTAGLTGVCHRRTHRRAGPAPAVHDDPGQRRFLAEAPDRLWVTDVTEHPTTGGKVHCAAVLDVFPAPSWSGRSPTTCAQSSSSTPWRWPAGGAAHRPVRGFTATAAVSTRPGSSATGCEPPGCWAPGAGWPPASTTA